MELAVLGALACVHDDGRTVVPQRRDRVLLACLAVDRHRIWSVDELADAIWRGDPPGTAGKLVRNRVSHLRGVLGPALIDTVASGYRLGDSVTLDIERLAYDAAGNQPRRTGRPFADLEDWPRAWPVIAHLTETLRIADETALDAALTSGAAGGAVVGDPVPGGLVARAQALAAEEPLRERRWALLVRALHAAGLQRDALAAAAQGRRAFADVGLPSPAELDAQERIVLASLDHASAATGGPGRDGLDTARRTLIGRDDDLRRVGTILTPGRLVSLTGPGGVGKTALASAIAASVADRFADGVSVCDLTTATSDDVPTVVAATLGLRPDRGLSTSVALADALRLQQRLVVLDNCEHVLDAVASLVSTLLPASTITVLVTSRESIGAAFEHVHPVQPLATTDAVALFRRRRGAVLGTPTEQDDDLAIVADVCEQLDGLPLAIELAASRAATISARDLLARLDERFRLLRADRASVGRHRGLDDTIRWSYSLLTDRERTVFDRLSVLAGPFTLAAAEAMCADAGLADAGLSDADVAEAVLSLVDKSMVATDGTGRYRLLETLRHFGARQLRVAGQHHVRSSIHAQHYADVAVRAHAGLRGADAARWYRELDADWANLRAAFSWSVAHGRPDLAVVVATRTLWMALFHDRAEPYAWVTALSTTAELAGDADWPGVLAGAAWAAFERGDVETAEHLAEAALAAEATANPNTDAFAELTLQSVAYLKGQVDDAERWVEHAEARARSVDDPVLEACTGSVGRAILALGRGAPADAVAHARHAGRLARRASNPTVAAWALAWEAEARQAAGDPDALAAALEAVELADTVGAWLPRSSASRVLAQQYLASGRAVEAAGVVRSCLRTMRQRGSRLFVAMYIGLTVPVLLAAGEGEAEEAAWLLGAFAETPPARYATVQPLVALWSTALGSLLPDGRLAELSADGAYAPLETAAVRAERALDRLTLEAGTLAASGAGTT